MSCPTCNHTMANLGMDQVGRRVFWCERCGTLKTESESGFVESQAPTLVERCEDLLKRLEINIIAVKESIGEYKKEN